MPKGKQKTYAELVQSIANTQVGKLMEALPDGNGIKLTQPVPPADITSKDPKRVQAAMTRMMQDATVYGQAIGKLESWKLASLADDGIYRRQAHAGGGREAMTPQEKLAQFDADMVNFAEARKLKGFENLLLMKGKTLTSIAGAIRIAKETGKPLTLASITNAFKTRQTSKETATVQPAA